VTRVDEIAADIFRISTYVPEVGIQFNQFLVRDDEPLLFETGMKQIFPLVREAVSKVIAPASLRYVSFSHFEPDECGSLNDWLSLAPRAEALCSVVGAMVFVNDAAVRPARGLTQDVHHGKIPVPIQINAPSASRMGRRCAFRRNDGDAVLFRLAGPCRRPARHN
jgi:hypothetical protein